jgi:methionyl-tRNA formyltransferase
MSASARILVFGYGEVCYECLEALLTRRENIVAVLTHQDDTNERIWFRSVAELSSRHGIPVFTPDSVNRPEWIARIREIQPDLILSFYYRHLICQAILDMPPLGAFNMHGSLLPRYRGRVPTNWAVLHGETETGATLHHMVKKPDAGDIVDQEAVPIGPEETAQQVLVKVAKAARRIIERQIEPLKSSTAPRRPQDETRATYFGGRRPEDGRIDWSQSAARVFNLVRAVTHPYPGAFTQLGGRRLFIWWASPRPDIHGSPGEIVSTHPLYVAAGTGGLEILALQWEGAEEQRASEGKHGLRAGQVLGTAGPLQENEP